MKGNTYFEHHFNGKDACEGIIKILEDLVARGMFSNRVLGCQSDTASGDDDHDEEIEIPQVDDEVTKAANAEKRKGNQCFSCSAIRRSSKH